MKIFVEDAPSFYHVALYNELVKDIDISVVYSEDKHYDRSRNEDFFGSEPRYRVTYIDGNLLKKAKMVVSILRHTEYEEIVIGGWGHLGHWLFWFFSPKKKNSCIIESSLLESQKNGIRGFVKRMFLKKISTVYAAGMLQAQLAYSLGFKGNITISGGCGLLNYKPQPSFEKRTVVKNFLYVGRFVKVKNLKLLIEAFNKLPQLNLMMVGFGEEEENLKAIAMPNIKFLGQIKNIELWQYYRDADVFILPSLSETWGLVVEEALNNGTPVIVSDRVGCKDDLVTSDTGLVFKHDSIEDLIDKINLITDIGFYNNLRLGVSKLNFIERAQQQINTFI